jgi:hypothetical protein
MPATPLTRGRTLAVAPTLALGAGAVLLAISLFVPYWEMRWQTASSPGPSRLVGFLDRIEGPVESLPEPGASTMPQRPHPSRLRRASALTAIAALCLLVAAAAFVRNRWAAVISLPGLLFPAVVLADVTRWLRPVLERILATAGDGAREPPNVLLGRVAAGDAFVETRARVGLLVYLVAVLVVMLGLWLHRRAYKPRRADDSPR